MKPDCHRRRGVGAILAFFVLASMHAGELVTLSGRAMGTTWAVKFLPVDQSIEVHAIERRISERLEQLEQEFSTFRPTSEISRFNAAPDAQDWRPVSAEFAAVAAMARAIGESTAGAFDPTVEPLVRLWGFGPAEARASPPTSAEIAAACLRVGWRDLETQHAAIRRTRSGVTIDLSSIAKGFASDALGELLVSRGVTNYFVQVGGDVKTGGGGAGGEPWRVGIESPAEGARGVAAVVALNGLAVSTSGNYRNFVKIGGRRLGHIIDPRSGVPVENELAAVTVVHASCALSSAWATALFVLGSAEGRAAAERERMACLFFVRGKNGEIGQQTTAQFQKLVANPGVAVLPPR